MGVMSRRVVPACGNLCICCPSMRARSRQPVKRYKKLIADIFPRNQDAEPNDRKIGKLCDYASKNPLRIPKITNQLEQRCFKDLRNENFGSVKVVLCIYRKLLQSCKEQMPLFAGSLLGIVRILLEQTHADEMQSLGCIILVEFISTQIDSTYMFNLEGLIPKLCQLAQEEGSNGRAQRLRSAGLQNLAAMVLFMGEQSHISMDFDKIISVTMENYLEIQSSTDNGEDRPCSQPKDHGIQGVLDAEDKGSSTPLTAFKSPGYWSRVCLCNMARWAREATSMRRVLEPLFQNFDAKDQWSLEKGLANSVLQYMQTILEESGENSHLLLSTLVKHLDHKSIVKQPLLQIDIVNVTTQLARNAKQQVSITIIGAISDLIKHLRKCLQNSAELPSHKDYSEKCNTDLQCALEKCIFQLANKVGDVAPILDMLAGFLENIPTNSVVARTTISAICQTAKILSSVPNVSYHKKAFPDALFHHLLLAMAHPDHEMRLGAHSVFSVVLMPSLVCPCIDQKKNTSVSVSGFSSFSVSKESRGGSFCIQDENRDTAEHTDGLREKECPVLEKISRQTYSLKYTAGKTVVTSLRLSSHQVSLLLSSIWVQATSVDNTPANFEAMAQTYSIAILFTRFKDSSHMALVRCFQLAFSLGSISLDQEGCLRPSRRRCLFTLASFMLLFSARAANLSELIPLVKAYSTDKMADPYLQLVDDLRLQAVCIDSEKGTILYGSPEDEDAALKFLSTVGLDEKQLKEAVISNFMTKYAKLSEEELSCIKEQLLWGFSPDEAYPLGVPLFMETPRRCSPLAQLEFPDIDEVMPAAAFTDDEAFPEPSGSQSDRKTSISTNSLDILSVNQLLESVLETARQVASFPVSSTPIPYDEMKSQCEALVSGKQQKMSVLHSFKQQRETKAIVVSSEIEYSSPPHPTTTMEYSEGNVKLICAEPVRGRDQLLLCSHEYKQHSFRLPPSSPYDKFLKAAGC